MDRRQFIKDAYSAGKRFLLPAPGLGQTGVSSAGALWAPDLTYGSVSAVDYERY